MIKFLKEVYTDSRNEYIFGFRILELAIGFVLIVLIRSML